MGLPKASLFIVPTTAPSEVALTNNTDRTPSTTRPTLVTISIDYNTIPLATERTGDITVGATTYGTPVILRNFDAVTARRMTQFVTITVPANTAYKINMSSATNLTLRAMESVA